MSNLSIIVQNAPCTKCKDLEDTHVDGKCLFGSTEYRPYSSYAVRMALAMNNHTLQLNYEIRRVVFVANDVTGPAEYGVHVVNAIENYNPNERVLYSRSRKYAVYGVYRSHLDDNQAETMSEPYR